MRFIPTAMLDVALALALGPATVLAGGYSAVARKPVKIGFIADVTGSAGAYGTSQKNAFDLASDDLREHRIDAGGATLAFDLEDVASDPAQVITLMRKFSGDGTARI